MIAADRRESDAAIISHSIKLSLLLFNACVTSSSMFLCCLIVVVVVVFSLRRLKRVR